MNKANTREMLRAAPLAAAGHTDYAASMLATLHRSAHKADQAVIEAEVRRLNLQHLVEVINGAMVLKGPRP